jgi:hypothetical protein
MEAVCCFENYVPIYRSAQCHNQEGQKLEVSETESHTLKLEAVSSSETLLPIYYTTR